jgi:hypothetical protein
VALEVPGLWEAGAADGALEGFGVGFFVPSISPNQLAGGLYGDVEGKSNLRSHGRRKVLAQQRKVFGTGEVEAGGARVEAGVSPADEVRGLFIDVLSLVELDFRVEW